MGERAKIAKLHSESKDAELECVDSFVRFISVVVFSPSSIINLVLHVIKQSQSGVALLGRQDRPRRLLARQAHRQAPHRERDTQTYASTFTTVIFCHDHITTNDVLFVCFARSQRHELSHIDRRFGQQDPRGPVVRDQVNRRLFI